MPNTFSKSAIAAMTCGLLFCGLGSSRCAASEQPLADDYFVKSWQTDDGLPGNAVNDVLQDQKGFIWLATIGGLVRFDGVTFKQFFSPLIAQVASLNIRALAETSDGTLLMLPAVGGVVQLNNGKFSEHPIGGDFAGRQFQTLFVDNGGAVWLGMTGGELRRWKNGEVNSFGPNNGLSSRAGVRFAEDGVGGVWIASGGFLGCYRDGKLDRFNENSSPTNFTVVASSRSGGIWICKNTELIKMDGGKFSTISTNLPWASLGGVVREMFEDSNQTLWIGTSSHGLFRFSNGKFARVETSQSQITAIKEDREGNIWVATTGGGINRIRPKLFSLYNAKSGLPEDMSDSVCADELGDVWLANRSSGVVRIDDGNPSILHLHSGPRLFSLCG